MINEILIGGALALLVLRWVFGSALAILPLISAAVSVLTMQLAIYGLTYLTDIHKLRETSRLAGFCVSAFSRLTLLISWRLIGAGVAGFMLFLRLAR